jgi:hypothetical protein
MRDMKTQNAKLKQYSPYIRWGGTELSMLGRRPDAEIARITCRSLAQVVAKRESLGITEQKLSA